MTLRHLLADDDLDPAEQTAVLDLADRLKADPLALRPLTGRSVAVLFDKTSTRTRVSFEVGIDELGGHPMIIETRDSQLGIGETIADTARVLGRHTAAVVWRTFGQERVEEMAAYAGVPVVNALTDQYHPCQILADLQTIREHLGDPAGRTFAFFGDIANNMGRSYALGMVTAGMHVRLAGPAGHRPDRALIDRVGRIGTVTGGSLTVTDDPRAAAAGADIIATDTWVSMGMSPEGRDELFRPYQVNADLVDLAAPEAIVMHCLPAHRGDEITAEVLDGPRSVIWDEVENRRHAQKAALAFLLEAGRAGSDGQGPAGRS
jgi:ornithine carbamoyltransferase